MASPRAKLAQESYEAHVVLMHNLGATLFNNVVVVTRPFLEANHSLLQRWLKASQLGWSENAVDPARFLAELREHYLTSARGLDAEIHANREFSRLMGRPDRYFAMSKSDVAANCHALSGLGYAVNGLFLNAG